MTNWMGVVVVPVMVAALAVLIKGIVAPYFLWKEVCVEKDALQHQLATTQVVRQYQNEFAGFKKTGSTLLAKVGPIMETMKNHFAPELPAQTDKWIADVTEFLMGNFGPMAVVDFENENYPSFSTNPNEHFLLFVRIQRHVSGLDNVINKWQSYQRL